MNVGPLLDLLLVLLLAATVFYCFRLDRRLSALREAQSELQSLLAGFEESIEKAQTGMHQLKTAAEGTVAKLQPLVERAQVAARELGALEAARDGKPPVMDSLAERALRDALRRAG